jgi:tRNA-splicing ligase RtcB
VRLLSLDITVDEIRSHVPDVLESLARAIPTRGRATGQHVATTLRRALEEGAPWAIDQGYGVAADLKTMESQGSITGADPGILTDKALAFAGVHLGTLGGGQHFVELGCIETIYDGQAALAYGLKADQVVILIHSGSRGIGQQILSDYQSVLSRASARHLIRPPARHLFCAPAHSHEGREYLGAMACAANFAFANRQIISHRAGSAIATALDRPRESLGLRTIYEQCHNTIALEVHDIQGLRKRVCVHRRGASVVLPPGHNSLPPAYHFVGQPIIIAGHWTTESYLCVPGRESRTLAFGSCPAGAGFKIPSAPRAESPHATTPENVLCIRADHRNAAATSDTPRDMGALLDTLETTKMARRAARIRPLGVLRS